ncbi:MAG: VWA domain-containing protein, partial [Phycisphaerales bacterium]|nr:VWA domain-containing protein [Phycisphaerales bacterium]
MMRFENPAWFIAALVAIPLAIIGFRWFLAMSVVRRASAVLARATLCVLLAALLAGAQLVRETDDVALVVVVDASESVTGIQSLESIRERLDALASRRGPDDLLGLVAFDGQAVAIASPTRASLEDRVLQASGVRGSNLEEALRLGAAFVPSSATGRILLVSDGNETSGDVVNAARDMASRSSSTLRIRTDVAPITYALEREVIVTGLDTPPSAPGDTTITARVTIEATAPTTGRLVILRDGAPIDANGADEGLARAVRLNQGVNVVRVPIELDDRRVHRFEAVFEPATEGAAFVGDTRLENNRAASFTVSPGRGRILVVDGVSNGRASGGGATLARALESRGLGVETIPPLAFPTDLLELEAFDLVILQNVASDMLPPGADGRLATWVERLGGGLVMTGGPDAFSAGGWRSTAVEALLPVRLQLPERLVMPDAAIIFVMDRSGSMGQGVLGSARSQQEIANEAAALAVTTLDAQDLIGVIAFNLDTRVVVPLAENSDPRATMERIRSIAPDGGTNLGPAML